MPTMILVVNPSSVFGGYAKSVRPLQAQAADGMPVLAEGAEERRTSRQAHLRLVS
ncbi:MAG: hypothetical protein ABJF23_02750 [Bryobacteraceae bacterium]